MTSQPKLVLHILIQLIYFPWYLSYFPPCMIACKKTFVIVSTPLDVMREWETHSDSSGIFSRVLCKSHINTKVLQRHLCLLEELVPCLAGGTGWRCKKGCNNHGKCGGRPCFGHRLWWGRSPKLIKIRTCQMSEHPSMSKNVHKYP
jgi:hypothetical protein